MVSKHAFQSSRNHGDILGWQQEPSHLETLNVIDLKTKGRTNARDFERSSETRNEFDRPNISFKNVSTVYDHLSWQEPPKQKKKAYTGPSDHMPPSNSHPDKNYRVSESKPSPEIRVHPSRQSHFGNLYHHNLSNTLDREHISPSLSLSHTHSLSLSLSRHCVSIWSR